MKKALIISCFDWYERRLEAVRQVLSEKYDVTILMADFNHIRKTKITQLRDECSYVRVPTYTRNLSLKRIYSHAYFGWKVKKYLNYLSPQLIYLLLPPNNSAKYCLEYKRKHPQIKYIIDLIDLWPESLPKIGMMNNFIMHFWASLRNESLCVADYVFTECSLFQTKLTGILNSDRTSTLYIYKTQSQREKELVSKIIADRVSPERKHITLAYLGSINHIIDIKGICCVIKELHKQDYQMSIEVIGDGESREEFLNALVSTGAEVHYHGKVFDERKKIEILTPCDFGLNMMQDFAYVGLTIKSIDYLSYGLPMINNIKGDTWRMIESEKIGINVGSESFDLKEFNHKIIFESYLKYFTKESYMKSLRGII